MLFTEERIKKIKALVANRQYDLTVILENVHDPHNVGAIIRSCEAVGVLNVHIVYTEPSKNSIVQYIGKKASRGAKRWVNIHFYDDVIGCIDKLKNEGYTIFATHLGAEAKSLYDIDLTKKCALLFGNEKDGVTEEALHVSDQNFMIPTFGMVQSLNVSVASAVSLFEASRQRKIKGYYDKTFDVQNPEMRQSLIDYVRDSHPRIVEANPTVITELIDFLKI